MDASEIKKRIAQIESDISKLPPGTVVYKTINGKKQPYLQWSEAGKTRSRYVKAVERDTVLRLVEMRKNLASELRSLKAELNAINSVSDRSFTYEAFNDWGLDNVAETSYLNSYGSAFRTRVVGDKELERLTAAVKGFEKRDCYQHLYSYLNGEERGRVCLLYGLRRTGKTTLLFQAINDLGSERMSKAAYIKARITDTMADIDHDLKMLADAGFIYLFIDEVTLISDFIDSAALFSDIFAMQGIKIILSGTDSLGFWMSLTNELYDRAVVIHTTYIPFHEYSRLLGIDDIDEYIRYGGTLRAGETAFDDPDLRSADAAFRDDESTRRYIDSAICHNIQHSLAYCSDGGYLRHLRELYETGELTGAINRTIERMNHRFLLQTLVERFRSHDLGSAAEVLRKQPDRSKSTDILDIIDRERITSKLKGMLDIKDLEDQQTGITMAHVNEIREYLEALDLVMECPAKTIGDVSEDLEYCLFTQPGMRYSQAQALVYVLMQDPEFASFRERDKNIACGRILEEVRGRMLEDIVLMETSKALGREYKVFKLTLARSEIDMVVYDAEADSCRLYEVKHSREIVPRQYHVLEDEEQLKKVSSRFGRIDGRAIIYRGPSRLLDNGIRYINAEEYLKGLSSVLP